jgi:DNA modification methylase
MKIRDRIKEFRRVKASELAPSPKNWRTHPKAQKEALQGLLAEIGFAGAVLARETPDGLMLIDGHLRTETAADSEIPVLILDVDEAEADKILATFDPIGAMAGADAAALDALLRGVETSSEAVAGMLAELAKEAGLNRKEITEDEPPEPPVDPITKTGDLWILGDHRVLCGDSTKAEDVGRLMEGAKAGMMVTDPPYNVEYEGNYIQSGRILKKEQKVWSGGIANDNLSNFGEWLASAFAASDAAIDAAIDAGAAIYVWHPSGEDGKYFWAAWPYDRWHFQVDLVWNKTSLIISRWDYKPQHEPCMYGWKGKNRSWIGPNNEPTVWDIPRQQGASGETREHPTQKPVECMTRAVRNHEGSVYDPFLGSGTTLIAAEQLGRKCYGMEISPQYCDVIVKRWETLTGKKAEKQSQYNPATELDT